MIKIKVYIGSDHAGFVLKEKLKPYISKLKYKVIDTGNKKYDKNDDYPIYASKLGKIIVKNKNSLGILICASGQGVCIAANKIKGIRAALAENVRDAILARRDDNSNIICLQGKYTKTLKAKLIVKKFLETKYEKVERFQRRINEIKKLEK